MRVLPKAVGCSFSSVAAALIALGVLSGGAQADANRSQVLIEKLAGCWNLPAGLPELSVKVRFLLDRDGSIIEGPTLVSPSTDKTTKILEASALRAVKKCNPFTELTAFPESYDDWREVIVDFSPKMLEQTDTPQTTTAEAVPPQGLGGEWLDVQVDGKRIRIPMPAGYCRVAPDGTAAEREFINRAVPPSRAKANLIAVGVDCETSKVLRAGKLQRMSRLFWLNRLTNEGLPDGEAFLADAYERFNAMHPLTERYWQSPPVPGSPVVGRDSRAVYVAQRGVKDGRVEMSGISAYAYIEGLPLVIAIMSFGGTDVTRADVDIATRLVANISSH